MVKFKFPSGSLFHWKNIEFHHDKESYSSVSSGPQRGMASGLVGKSEGWAPWISRQSVERAYSRVLSLGSKSHPTLYTALQSLLVLVLIFSQFKGACSFLRVPLSLKDPFLCSGLSHLCKLVEHIRMRNLGISREPMNAFLGGSNSQTHCNSLLPSLLATGKHA